VQYKALLNEAKAFVEDFDGLDLAVLVGGTSKFPAIRDIVSRNCRDAIIIENQGFFDEFLATATGIGFDKDFQDLIIKRPPYTTEVRVVMQDMSTRTITVNNSQQGFRYRSQRSNVPNPWRGRHRLPKFAAGALPDPKRGRDHFLRLCAYWLQAENRQGQLDSIPVLPLRHQASLVEHLMRRDTPMRMLIGDEVGLGKTVEIGLLIERLQAANPNVRVLYITLGGLVSNVAEEFSDMGLERFYVFGNQTLYQQGYTAARLGQSDQDPRVVASLNRLAFGEHWEDRLKNTKWDVVIVDECHRLRMYGTGEDKKAQKWFRVVETIITAHLAENGRVYFLSGTPHQGNPDVFLNLAGLLCGLPRSATAQQQRSALGGHVIYRIKEEIRDWDNNPLFPKRDIRNPVLAPTPPEYNAVLSSIADYFDWLLYKGTHLRSDTRQAIGFVKGNALQYAASSPKAGFAYLLRRYLRNFADEGNRNRMEAWASLLIPYRGRSAKEKPSELLDYLKEAVRPEEDQDVEDDETTLTESVGPSGAAENRQEEERRLGQLLDEYARLLKGPLMQAKFECLRKLLEEADEPFVVFAQSVDTVYEIKRFLAEASIPCNIIVGGQDSAERKRQMQNFSEPGRLGRRVLVSSSAGGEGINLQISRWLVHFDLPWNPMVLEQRIGRIHRIGTIDTVIVNTILLDGSREADIYVRLIFRLNTIVMAVAQDPELRIQYFRRILAGIPLETLRNLFSGEQGDDAAIAAAVEAGKQAVELVDKELRQHRVQLTDEDRGRASMTKLVRLLEMAEKIKQIKKQLTFTRVKFDSQNEKFVSKEVSQPCYRINHGAPNAGVDWVVFDREAAAMSPEVTKERTGGINHPLIALALRSLRTPADTTAFPGITIGAGRYRRGSGLEVLVENDGEPVALLTYLVAFSNGGHFFNHRLRVYAVSPSRGKWIDISSDGKLVEDILWSQLDSDESISAMPEMKEADLQNIVNLDRTFRLELEASLKDEDGNWIGAAWPIAMTLLVSGSSVPSDSKSKAPRQ
jgi:superfamily II DNA or RNA helicase